MATDHEEYVEVTEEEYLVLLEATTRHRTLTSAYKAGKALVIKQDSNQWALDLLQEAAAGKPDPDDSSPAIVQIAGGF